MNSQLVCHVVAGYPNEAQCLQLLSGMHDANVKAIEVQIPFSDPIADGEAIMEANDRALDNGMTVQKSFEFVAKARSKGIDTELYIMSYIQKIQHTGYEAFCTNAHEVKTTGLIIPDLPVDTIEYEELSRVAQSHDIQIIPVLSPGMSETRLQKILAKKPPLVYLTSRRGITGTAYTVADDLNYIARTIREDGNSKIIIGFGIANAHDVKDALRYGDMAVIGSAIVRSVHKDGVEQTIDFIKSLTAHTAKKEQSL